MKYTGPIILREFSSTSDAYIALGLLRSAGIACELENEIISSVLAVPTSMYCGIKLLINPADLEQAEKIISEIDEKHS